MACLRESYTGRTNELNAQFKTAGSLSIEKRVVARSLPRLGMTKPIAIHGSSAVLARGWMRQSLHFPAAAASKRALRRVRHQARCKAGRRNDIRRYYEIHRSDDRLISIEFFQYHESYIGHGWRSEFAINWDLKRGRALRTADIFESDTDWQQGIYDYAMKDLREQGDIAAPESWFSRAEVDDDEAWVFDGEAATLLLGHGERSMVGASADVSIPYEVFSRSCAQTFPCLMSAGSCAAFANGRAAVRSPSQRHGTLADRSHQGQ